MDCLRWGRLYLHWGRYGTSQIVGTITAADTALAGLLGLSKKNYQEDDADA